MNDAIQRQLRIVVERAVRPVLASTPCKRRMREELLAHLAAIYEEEAARLGDEQAALDRAKERFGDPGQLVADLQQSVPKRDWLARLWDHTNFRPGESLPHVAVRHGVLMLVAFVIMVPFAAIFWLIRRPPDGPGLFVHVMLGVAIVTVVFSVVFETLALGMYRALWRDPAARSWRQALCCAALSALVFPAIAFSFYWALTGDPAGSLAQVRLACCFAPLAPLLFVAISRQVSLEMRGDEEWASLEIDE